MANRPLREFPELLPYAMPGLRLWRLEGPSLHPDNTHELYLPNADGVWIRLYSRGNRLLYADIVQSGVGDVIRRIPIDKAMTLWPAVVALENKREY